MSSRTPKRLGKYELVERLGQGGAAEVWKAFDTQLQRFVAIKLLHPDLRDDPNFVQRFQREAQLIASLHHPNIMQIHDFQIYQPPEEDQEENGGPIAYMVMDYLEGGTLSDYIRPTSVSCNHIVSDSVLDITSRAEARYALMRPGCALLDGYDSNPVLCWTCICSVYSLELRIDAQINPEFPFQVSHTNTRI